MRDAGETVWVYRFCPADDLSQKRCMFLPAACFLLQMLDLLIPDGYQTMSLLKGAESWKDSDKNLSEKSNGGYMLVF